MFDKLQFVVDSQSAEFEASDKLKFVEPLTRRNNDNYRLDGRGRQNGLPHHR
jgi:hypothetical protein